MITETQKIVKPRVSPVAVSISLVSLFFIFRFTAVASLILWVLLYVFFTLHHSRRALYVAYALFVAALLIPVDVYVPGFHGPLHGSKHSGLRFVHVVHGMPMIQRCLDKYGEFIADGCVVGIHDTRWRLVWD